MHFITGGEGEEEKEEEEVMEIYMQAYLKTNTHHFFLDAALQEDSNTHTCTPMVAP